MKALHSNHDGLTARAAANRLKKQGSNILVTTHKVRAWRLFFDRFRSPLIIILLFAALVSVLVHDWIDAAIIIGIIFISAVLSFSQEYRASNAMEKLRHRVSVKAVVMRNGKPQNCPIEHIVQGDIVRLSAGSLMPGDGILIEAKDFYVSQAILTGETFPVEKQPGLASKDAILAERNNCVFMGTSVRSGTATALMVNTGRKTYYGQIAEKLLARPSETDFERGLKRFSGLLLYIMIAVVVTVFAANIMLHHPTMETFLFAMALSIGLSPELLPAILSITLTHGARKMAHRGVIVRRMNAIENLGSMNILCTDKTGTLTEGVIRLDGALDIKGQPSDMVAQKSYLNSLFQTGLNSPLDEAVVNASKKAIFGIDDYRKMDEIPYDFVRKRLSIVVKKGCDEELTLITKGALQNILDICDRYQCGNNIEIMDDVSLSEIKTQFENWSKQGYRVLGIAQVPLPLKTNYGREDEKNMVFIGFLLFFDPPKEGIQQALNELHIMGVDVKVITGDNCLVARHVAEIIGLKNNNIVTGSELIAMKDEALWHLAPKTNIFAEVDPNQKERIIRALQKNGCVVGYLGDGINDAPALYIADVGISVDKAVDVAKEAADIVLLERDLEVVRQGIHEGRRTFANTIKYIFLTISANFGNMISMALASFFIPFLPLLAKQILLNNFLSDIPAMGIANDNVDNEWVNTPRQWNICALRNSMIIFGLVSTIFDILTFGVLLYILRASPALFRTGWFVESLLTELFIAFILRTHKPFYRSRPGRLLLWSTMGIMSIILLIFFLPVQPICTLLGFVPMSPLMIGILLGITIVYIAVTEIVKRTINWRIG